MSLSIISGVAEVLHSTVVTTFGGMGAKVTLNLSGRDILVEVNFESDVKVEDVAVNPHYTDDGLSLTLINFDGDDGRGSAWPVPVTAVGENTIFLHFRVFKYGRSPDRTLHLTFYSVANVDFSYLGPPGGPLEQHLK